MKATAKPVQNRPGTFKPGNRANPGGRPKGLASMIRGRIKEGKTVVDLYLEVLEGKTTITRYTADGIPYEAGPTIKERMEAGAWLVDRGYGKAIETVSLDNPASANPITPEIEVLSSLLAKSIQKQLAKV